MNTPIHDKLWSEHYEPRRRFAEVVPFAAVFFALTLLAVLIEVWR